MSETIQCPACKASNPPGATWCSLCFTPFTAPEPDEPPPPAPGPSSPAPAAPPPPPPTPAPPEGEQLALIDETDGKTWTCRFCDTQVPVGEVQCPTCQQSIYDSFGGRAPEVELDPMDALRRSALPGGGHFALNQGIMATTILIITLISLGMGVYLLVQGAVGFGATLTFIGLTVWMLAAHDAFRMASGHKDEIFLRPRVLSVVMGIWFLVVVAAARAARQVISP